jgi:hypothetical protein
MGNPKCRDPRRSIGAARGQVGALVLGGLRRPPGSTPFACREWAAVTVPQKTMGSACVLGQGSTTAAKQAFK